MMMAAQAAMAHLAFYQKVCGPRLSTTYLIV